jgi:lysophospholipase L1-like esterase
MKYIICLLFILTLGNSKRVLFVGDSLTKANGGWQDILSSKMNLESVNISKVGNTTKSMLDTLKKYLKNDHKFKSVAIYGGVNDIYMNVPIDTILTNIQKMVNISNSYHVKPIVIMGYDGRLANRNTWLSDKVYEAKIHDNYILYQKRLKVEIKNATVTISIPITKNDLFDGIHLTLAGHVKVADIVQYYFK